MNNQTEPASDSFASASPGALSDDLSMVEQFRKEADEAFAQSKLTDWHKVTFLIGYRMGRESRSMKLMTDAKVAASLASVGQLEQLERDNEQLRLYIQRLTNQRDALADVADPIQPPFESK